MVLENCKNIHNLKTFNKVNVYNHNGVLVPVFLLDIELIQDNKKIKVRDLFEQIFNSLTTLSEENAKLKNEIKLLRNQVANGLALVQEEINDKGVI